MIFFIFAQFWMRAKSKKYLKEKNYFVGVQASVKLKSAGAE
jgi:hypothetical protein